MSQIEHEFPILDLLSQRRSLYTLDPTRDVAPGLLGSLFEAARWSMSSFNAQPWRYIVAAKSRSPERWEQLHSVLVSGNQPWTANAPVLALGLVQTHFEYNGQPNRTASHDLGAASALLTVEATRHGLVVHQMSGIERDKAREVFAIDAALEPVTALAIGYPGTADQVSEALSARDAKPRERKALRDILLQGQEDIF